MQIAVFSDVHGNLEALTQVWSALERDGLDCHPVLNAGDNVGYGDHPEECVRFIQCRPNILNVRGNYDKNVAAFPKREAEYRDRWKKTRPDKYAALKNDSAVISDNTRRWLADLPKELKLKIAGSSVLLTHYSPSSKEGLTPWTAEDTLKQHAKIARVDVVVCGHTHMAFVRRAGGTLFVNPGAIGRTLRRNPTYAVLTLGPDGETSAEVRSL